MGNGLLDAGFRVRIACMNPARPAGERIRRSVRRAVDLLRGRHTDWIPSFRGTVATFRESLEELGFAPGEIVIAVGSYTVRAVADLARDVRKIRYCHGFTGSRCELMAEAWGRLPMRTLAVAPGLVPELERLSGEPVAAVIPNGIHPAQYFVEEGLRRDGIGTVYYEHPNKCPHDTLAVLERLRARQPQVPWYVFGADARPSAIPRRAYVRLPTISAARQRYNRSKVWFLASRYEGFGLPMLEAMTCGAAVVTTPHDGCDGLIEDGENGLVVPHGDVAGLAGAIERLLADDDLRERLAARGLETARRFTWTAAVNAMAGFLRSVCAGHTVSGRAPSCRA
jgi:glycosyltransferase involved in cell wall biosynthesis